MCVYSRCLMHNLWKLLKSGINHYNWKSFSEIPCSFPVLVLCTYILYNIHSIISVTSSARFHSSLLYFNLYKGWILFVLTTDIPTAVLFLARYIINNSHHLVWLLKTSPPIRLSSLETTLDARDYGDDWSKYTNSILRLQ